MLNPFMAMINFQFFIYVQRKKWDKTIVWSEELMAATRKKTRKNYTNKISANCIKKILWFHSLQVIGIGTLGQKTMFTYANINISYVCLTVYHWYNNTDNQLDATITVY